MNPVLTIALATSNEGKLSELRALLADLPIAVSYTHLTLPTILRV